MDHFNSLAQKIRAQLNQNAENLDFARSVFERAGYDVGFTMGDATSSFTYKNSIDTSRLLGRGDFHEACHILANCLNVGARSEMLVLVMETVQMRGLFNGALLGGSDNNQVDHEELERPKYPPLLKDVWRYEGLRRDDLIAARKSESVQVPHLTGLGDDLQAMYDRARAIDHFFAEVTNGRAMYQLASKKKEDVHMSLLDMPLCFFGLQPEFEGDIPSSLATRETPRNYVLIPEQQRQELIAELNLKRPHKGKVWEVDAVSEEARILAQ